MEQMGHTEQALALAIYAKVMMEDHDEEQPVDVPDAIGDEASIG